MITPESRRRANEKWRKRNLEYIAETARKKYETDEAYRQKVKSHNLAQYHLKKEITQLMCLSGEIFS